MSLRGSQSSLRSLTLKPTEPEFLKTNRSAWTPKLDAKNNHKLFLERVSLITHWHDKWNERQRKQLLVHLLQRTTESEMFSIREWIMKRMPEPLWQVDPSSVLPKWLMLHIFSYLTTAELCVCSKVSSHWRYLSEQDVLWRHRTARRGWFLPYNPPPTQHGAWKQYYVMCVKNSEKPSLLVDQQRAPTEPIKEEETYSRADLERLGKYFVNTDDPKPEPESPSRIFEKSGHEVEDFDASLYKERWVDPNKHPKDLDNWGKVTSQEYRPDIRYLQASKLKARSKSYTRLDVSSSSPLKTSDIKQESQLKSKSVSTITEIYRQHGSFRIVEREEGSFDKEPILLTKKGVAVPSLNYWLQKPDKPTIPGPDGHGAIPTPDLAGDVGCGAVWGENLPCHTHPKVLLISSDVPAYEMIVGTVVTGIIGIVYDAEKASLRSILNQVEHSLNGRKAESVGIFAPGKLGYLNLTRHIHISGTELHSDFWRELCSFLLEPKFGGRIDIFSSVGVSTVNQSLGMDIIYRLSGVTSIPFNAPLGGIYGEWAEICGTWLLHPDNVHPLSIYLKEDKVRIWVLFAKQLENIAEDMRLQFRHRLHIQHTAGLHRIVNAVLRQGLELLSRSDHTHLADILFYSLSKLCSESASSTTPPPNESDQVKRGVLCMRLVDVLLSSQFVKDLEEMKGEEKGEVSDVSEDPVAIGKDVLTMLEWMKRSVPLSLQTNSHRLIFPKGVVVDQRTTILEEIIRTERTFLRQMNTVEEELYSPLYIAGRENQKPILNPANIRICFADLLEVRKVHQVFLERLEHKQAIWSADQIIGDIFLKLAQRFDCYSNYINNYPSTITIYRKNINENPAFWAFVEHFDRQNSNRTKFFELLSRPMHRIESLKTLVSSLIFYTPDKHPDHMILEQCESEYQKLSEFIEQSRTQYNHLTELKVLESKVVDCPILTDKNRGIIAQAEVYRVKGIIDEAGIAHTFSQDKKFPHFQKYKLHLFDDAIMLSRVSYEIQPYDTQTREIENFVNTYALSAIRVKNGKKQHQFLLYTPKSIYLFEFETLEGMSEWVDHINNAIQNAPKLLVPNVYVSPQKTM